MPQIAKLSKHPFRAATDATSGDRGAEEVVKGLSLDRPPSLIEWHWIRAKQAIVTARLTRGPKFLVADL